MLKRVLVCLIFLVLFLTNSSYAQQWKLRPYEATLGLGTTNFYGDIGGTSDVNNALGFKDIQFQYTRPSVALGMRYKLASDMAVRMNLIYAVAAGNDLKSRNDARNFAFRTTIFEPSFQFEYYIIPEGRSLASPAMFNRRGMINNYSKIYVYVFGGIGGVLFKTKPLEDFEDRYVDNFSNFGLVFPVGAGLKFTIDTRWSMGFEFGRRYTTTDYIDGYTSPFSDHKDIYDFAVVNAILKIKADRRGRPMFRRSFSQR
jgi:OOP family OmpA-OmpF porin